MKKYCILLIVLFVMGLFFSYRKALQIERGENLVADAYYGDLLSVKNDVEEGAPLHYELYFADETKQYNGIIFNALHAAASSGNQKVINYLIDQKIPIDSTNPDGWTPLFVAARDGQSQAAQLLILRGAKLNLATNQGATALIMAITQDFPSQQDRMDLLEYMVRRGADVNQTDGNGFSPLYYAAVVEKPDLVKFLLAHKATANTKSVRQALNYLKQKNTPTAYQILRLLDTALQQAEKAQ